MKPEEMVILKVVYLFVVGDCENIIKSINGNMFHELFGI